MSRMLPKNVALTDRVLCALADGPGTAGEIAARAGTVACWCMQNGTPGERHDKYHDERCRWCERYPGWRPLIHSDVRPILERLARRGEVDRLKEPGGAVLYLPITWVSSQR